MRIVRCLLPRWPAAVLALSLPALTCAAETPAPPAATAPFPVIAGRGDGSGSFPDDCRPVTAWREYTFKAGSREGGPHGSGNLGGSGRGASRRDVPDKDVLENIVWRCALPNMGQGIPICVGKKVFVACDPGWKHDAPVLLCVDADTGSVLWEREVDQFADLTEEDATLARETRKRFWEKNKVAYRMNYEAWDVYAKDGGAGIDGLKARAAGLDIGMGGRYGAGLWGTTTGNPGHFRGTDQKSFLFGVSGNKGAWGSCRELKWLQSTHRWRCPGWHQCSVGFTFPAPVSDGRCVYVANSHHVLACYAFDGRLRWMRWHKEFDPNRSDMVDAPVLAPWPAGVPLDGRRAEDAGLVLICWDQTETGGSRFFTDTFEVWAYDKLTGRAVWKQEIGGALCAPLAPLHLKSADGKAELDVVVAENGTVVRLRDGAILAKGLGKAQPVGLVSDGVDTVYFGNGPGAGAERRWAEAGVAAVRLELTPEGGLRPTLRWHAPAAVGHGGLVFHRGVVYAVRGGGVAALDGQTGAVLAQTTGGPVGYSGYAPAAGGGHLFYVDNGGACGVFKLDPALKARGLSRLSVAPVEGEKRDQIIEQTGTLTVEGGGWFEWQFGRTAPFLSGNRLFIRSFDYLYCLGRKEEPFTPSAAFAGLAPEPALPAAPPLPDDAALEVLRARLALAQPEARAEAARALGRLGPAAAPAAKALSGALTDRDWNVRHEAGEALRRIGPEAVGALVEALKGEYYAQWHAAQTLGRIGAPAEQGVAALAEALAGGDMDVKLQAALALARMPDASPAAAPLVAALLSTDGGLRAVAAEVLGRTPAAVPALTALLSHSERGVRTSAAQALGRLGPAAAPAAREMAALLKSECALTGEAYKGISSRDSRHQQISHAMARNVVLKAVSRLGPAVVPPVAQCLEGEDLELASWVADAARPLGAEAAALVPGLVRAWTREAGEKWDWTSQRNHFALAFTALGRAAEPALSLLTEGLHSDYPQAVQLCASALGALGPKALPSLVAALGDADPARRAAAADALGRLGAAAAPALPELQKALADADMRVRRAAEAALKALATRPQPPAQ